MAIQSVIFAPGRIFFMLNRYRVPQRFERTFETQKYASLCTLQVNLGLQPLSEMFVRQFSALSCSSGCVWMCRSHQKKTWHYRNAVCPFSGDLFLSGGGLQQILMPCGRFSKNLFVYLAHISGDVFLCNSNYSTPSLHKGLIRKCLKDFPLTKKN